MTTLHVLAFRSDKPEQNLAREEQLLNQAEDKSPALCFYVNRPCVVLGRNNREEQWVHIDALRASGIPLLRRISGGGAVYHDARTLNYGIVLSQKHYSLLNHRRTHIIRFFRQLMIAAMAPAGIELVPARQSDLNLNGRKVGGCAAAIRRSGVLFHGTLLFSVDYDAYERFLPVPPNRPPQLTHRRFVTSLEQEGIHLGMHEVQGLLTASLATKLQQKQVPIGAQPGSSGR
ncbi:MAG: hypothetical protein B1H03_02550 [Planctomycetales bacterium 4484_113]|nr:MAG: hypothetical protein B1H03_02550 [Planctomycetales bacterium 4484_113]